MAMGNSFAAEVESLTVERCRRNGGDLQFSQFHVSWQANP